MILSDKLTKCQRQERQDHYELGVVVSDTACRVSRRQGKAGTGRRQANEGDKDEIKSGQTLQQIFNCLTQVGM